MIGGLTIFFTNNNGKKIINLFHGNHEVKIDFEGEEYIFQFSVENINIS